MKKECKNCKYWRATINDNNIGYCKINPPIITMLYNVIREDHSPFFGRFPQTFNDDWCGKFEANVEE